MAKIKSKAEQRVDEAPATNGVPVAQLAPETKAGKKCQIGRQEFLTKAPVLSIKLTDGDIQLAHFLGAPKEFSTGSFGWGVQQKQSIMINGKAVEVVVGMNLTIVKSKEAE